TAAAGDGSERPLRATAPHGDSVPDSALRARRLCAHLPQPLQGPPDIRRKGVPETVLPLGVVQQRGQGVVRGGLIAEGEQQMADAAPDVQRGGGLGRLLPRRGLGLRVRVGCVRSTLLVNSPPPVTGTPLVNSGALLVRRVLLAQLVPIVVVRQ